MNKTSKVNYKKLTKTLSTLVIVLLILLLSLGIYIVKSNEISTLPEKIELSNVDQNVLSKLENSIIFSGAANSTKQQYYSPVLSATFEYDDSILFITDGSESVSISTDDIGNFRGTLSIYPSMDVKADILSNKEKAFEDLKFIEEKREGDINFLLFSYQEPSLIDSNQKKENFLSALYKTLEDGRIVVLLGIRYNYTNPQATPSVKLLQNILETFNTDLSSFDKKTEVTLEDVLTFSYDLGDWQTIYHSENGHSISTQYSNKDLMGELRFTAYKAFKKYDEKLLDEELMLDYNSKQEVMKNSQDSEKKTEVIEAPHNLIISGITFRAMSYKHLNYIGDADYIDFGAIAFLPESELLITIKSSYNIKYAKTAEVIEDVIKTIFIKDKTILSYLPQSQEDGLVLGSSTVSLNTSTIMAQAASVRILSINCAKGIYGTILNMPSISGKTYTLCSAGTGTGFAVDSQGHFITNAHVAKQNYIDTFLNSMIYDKDVLDAFIKDIPGLVKDNSLLASFFIEDPESLILVLNAQLYEEGMLTITEGGEKLYIQGDEEFEIDFESADLANKASHTLATLVDTYPMDSMLIEYIKSGEAPSIIEPDLSLIKASVPVQYPNLITPTLDVMAGQDIFVVGYPGVSVVSSLFDVSNKMDSTVTKGTISAIRNSVTNKFKLLQVDASIDHGNSGGPIINSSGEVVGVATYGLTGASAGGDYNAGIYFTSVNEILSRNNISNTPNAIRNDLEKALDNIGKSYYKLALTSLQNVKGENASLNNIIDPLIDLSNSKIANSEDKTPIFASEDLIIPNWILFSFLGVFFGIIITVVLIIIFRKKEDNGSTIEQKDLPHASIPYQESSSTPPPAQVQQGTTTQPIPQQDMINTIPQEAEQPANPPYQETSSTPPSAQAQQETTPYQDMRNIK